jgi:predicted MFS family arabinose efflux permease
VPGEPVLLLVWHNSRVLACLGFVRSMVAIELASIPFFLALAFTTSLPVAVFAFLMRGALMNTTHPIHKNLMMQATPAGAREVQTGINATLWGFGWIVGPLAAGAVLDATGNDYRYLMCTTVAMYVTAAALTWILLRPVEDRLRPTRSEPGA